MSKINVDTWEPESGTAATLMASGDTVTVPSGASLVVASGATINITDATQTGFPSAGFIGYTVYTGNATWLKSTNTPTKVVVELVGGGGSSGSGRSDYYYGGSGGSAGYVRKYIDVSSLTSATVVVGAGGVMNAGTSAGNSSWTDNLTTNTLVGGAGGNGANGAPSTHGIGGTGGTAAGGDLNMPGSSGTLGGSPHGSMRTTNSAISSSGAGLLRTHADYGVAAVGPAYGGGASTGRGEAVTIDGAAGGVGVVIVWEYA
jgi:hypothetical protein